MDGDEFRVAAFQAKTWSADQFDKPLTDEQKQLIYVAKRADYRKTHGFRTRARGASDE